MTLSVPLWHLRHTQPVSQLQTTGLVFHPGNILLELLSCFSFSSFEIGSSPVASSSQLSCLSFFGNTGITGIGSQLAELPSPTVVSQPLIPRLDLPIACHQSPKLAQTLLDPRGLYDLKAPGGKQTIHRQTGSLLPGSEPFAE